MIVVLFVLVTLLLQQLLVLQHYQLTSICDKGTKNSRRVGELQTAGGAAPNSDRQCAHASMKVGRFHSLFFSVRQIWICDVVFIRRSMNYRTTSTAPAALLTIFQIKAVSTT